jgi:hypothetical protein
LLVVPFVEVEEFVVELACVEEFEVLFAVELLAWPPVSLVELFHFVTLLMIAPVAFTVMVVLEPCYCAWP